MNDKLYLSTYDKKIAGVCGGLSEYFEIDSTLVRVICILLIAYLKGAGIIAYIAMALIMPNRSREEEKRFEAAKEIKMKDVDEFNKEEQVDRELDNNSKKETHVSAPSKNKE